MATYVLDGFHHFKDGNLTLPTKLVVALIRSFGAVENYKDLCWVMHSSDTTTGYVQMDLARPEAIVNEFYASRSS